jgi:hypothetical protein
MNILKGYKNILGEECISGLKYSVMCFCILCEHDIDKMHMYNQGYSWEWRVQVVQPLRGVGSNGQKNEYFE